MSKDSFHLFVFKDYSPLHCLNIHKLLSKKTNVKRTIENCRVTISLSSTYSINVCLGIVVVQERDDIS